MAPSKKKSAGGGGGAKKKKSSEALKTTKTVATKKKEESKPKSNKSPSKSRSNNGEPKNLVVPSSSTESQTRKKSEKKGGKIANQRTTKTNAKANGMAGAKSKSKSQPKARSKLNGAKQRGDDDNEVEEGSAVCAFPMNRIKVIMRSGGPDWRITHEAIFLINKASEKFLEKFCEDAVDSAKNLKNYLGYKHLSSLVCKERRYDFLSDFVPKRVKAEDALAERQAAET